MRAVRTHLSLPCLRKAPQISLLGGLFYFRCHLPCGKYGGICCVYSEKKQQCLTEHVACLDAPDSIVLFLITKYTRSVFWDTRLLCCVGVMAARSSCSTSRFTARRARLMVRNKGLPLNRGMGVMSANVMRSVILPNARKSIL